ncbi:hypothetical protein ABPG74_017358 [Tetrahymena malaccensis]
MIRILQKGLNYQQKQKQTQLAQQIFNQFSSSLKERTKAEYSLKEGDQIHGFQVQKIENINDFNITAYYLTHLQTDAKFIHFDTKDKNNCLAVIFRTTPHDDKGTPHILEHLTCCGSEKYPVRDPFFKMIKRSLNTYMNAWTGPDFTCYPFSSQNPKDFKNLMEVYLANTFSPLLKKSDFQQEGWRYDFDEETGDLQYKGVVFNEMKGVYQSSENIFSESLAKYSIKDSVYNHNYGGDPKAITDLSYQEIKDFYNKFYHPSNSKIFSYGDLDFTENLKYINENYFTKFQKLSNFDSSVKPSKRLEKREEYTLKGPEDPVALDKDKQVKMSISFLCNDLTQDQIEGNALNLISYLLCDTATSPLYKALLESGVAPSYSPGNGFEMHYREGLFNLGVQGISEQDTEAVEKIIFDTLKQISEEGFDEEMIEGALHQIEIGAKIPKDNFGIMLIQMLMTQIIHDGDVSKALKVTENIQTLRKKIFEEKYLQKLIDKYFLSNKHQVKIIMKADSNYHQEQAQIEAQKLKNIQAQLTQEQIQQIKEDNKTLEKEQSNKNEDYSCLPTLEVSDIDREVESTEFKQTAYKDIPIYFTNQNTNGLTFLRIQFDLERVPLFIRQYLDLFCTFITRIGTKQMKHDEFHKQMSLYTTNFSFDFQSSNRINNNDDPNGPFNYALLNVACIDRNIEHMFELLQELLTTPDFNDMTNISTILRNTSNEVANSIIDQSMQYAFSVGSASLRENFFMKEKLKNTRFLCNYSSNFFKSQSKLYLDDLCFQMHCIIDYMIKKHKIKFIVHGDQKNFDQIYNNITRMVDNFSFAYPAFKTKNEPVYFDEDYPNPFQRKYINKFFTLPMQVNYCIQSLEVPHYTHPDTPALNLFAELVATSVLHTEIREKGGAYGSGCKLQDGVMNFFSYRDPNILQTIETYAKGVKMIADGQFNEENLKESKLSLFSKYDKIINPQDKGLSYALEGVSDLERAKYRQGIIDANRENIIRVAREHVQKKIEKNECSKVIFGSELADLDEIEKSGYSIEEPVPGFTPQKDEQENEEN